MKLIFVLLLSAFAVACSTPGPIGQSSSSQNSQRDVKREIASVNAQPMSVVGEWTGHGTIAYYGYRDQPVLCGKLVVRATKTAQGCEWFGSQGENFATEFNCADDLLSPKGQALFNRTVNLCQKIDKHISPSTGEQLWITNIGRDTTSPDSTASICEVGMADSSRGSTWDTPSTPQYPRFFYSDSVNLNGNQVRIEAVFYRSTLR